MSVHLHIHDASSWAEGSHPRSSTGQFTAGGGKAAPKEDHWKQAKHHRARADFHQKQGNKTAEKAHREAYRAHAEAARNPSAGATRLAQGRSFLAGKADQ
jgi:hypothetical protein